MKGAFLAHIVHIDITDYTDCFCAFMVHIVSRKNENSYAEYEYQKKLCEKELMMLVRCICTHFCLQLCFKRMHLPAVRMGRLIFSVKLSYQGQTVIRRAASEDKMFFFSLY